MEGILVFLLLFWGIPFGIALIWRGKSAENFAYWVVRCAGVIAGVALFVRYLVIG